MMWRVAIISMAVVGLSLPTTVLAQQCPPELEQAKSKISSIQTAGQSKDTQAPRSLAGYEGGSRDAPAGLPGSPWAGRAGAAFGSGCQGGRRAGSPDGSWRSDD